MVDDNFLIEKTIKINQNTEPLIAEIPYLKSSHYSKIDIESTINSYIKRYVVPLKEFKEITANHVIADIGAGFGWLAMAFAVSTEARIIAIDFDKERILAGKEIAKILEITNIEWRVGSVEDIPLKDAESDVTYCIEVIEHVQKSPNSVQELSRVTSDILIITTPNLWFPIIAHDTKLPFCHWFPIPIRQIYARLFGRIEREDGNLFWSPFSLMKYIQDFKPISKWLHHNTFESYVQTFPYYDPYQAKTIKSLSNGRLIYYKIVSKLGMFSHWFVPSLAYVFQRKK